MRGAGTCTELMPLPRVMSSASHVNSESFIISLEEMREIHSLTCYLLCSYYVLALCRKLNSQQCRRLAGPGCRSFSASRRRLHDLLSHNHNEAVARKGEFSALATRLGDHR